MGFGQITELADTFTQPLPHNAAGTDSDEPLHGLIPQRLFIGPGIIPGNNAVHAVWRREQVHDAYGKSRQKRHLGLEDTGSAHPEHNQRQE